MKGSKLLKLVGLGIALWGLSLLWPKVNLVLTPVVMIGLLVGLGLVMVAYSLGRQFGQPVNQPQASDRTRRVYYARSTRPVAIIFPASGPSRASDQPHIRAGGR